MSKRERPPLLFKLERDPRGHVVRGLFPADETTLQAFDRWKVGDTIQADNLRKPRSLPRHRFYWKALSEIVAATECAPTAEHLHAALKIGTGYAMPVKLQDGTLVWVPDSTSFEAMDDAEFAKFMDTATKWTAENLGISLSDIMEGQDR